MRKTNPASNPSLQFVKTGAFMPSKFRTSLRFALNLAAASSTSSTNVVLAGNNLFDPGLSSATAQCVGFDQLAGIYNRYRVIGSRINIKTTMSASATAGVTQISGAVNVAPSNTGLGRTLFADAISQPYAKWVDITSSAVKEITLTMQTSKILGQTNLEGSDRTQGLISGAPGEEWYWIITYVSDAAYTNGQIVIDAQTTYDVEFFDRNDLDRSTMDGKQIHSLYHEIYQIRCKQLLERKKPHNADLPVNWSKYGVAPPPDVRPESKEDDYIPVTKPKLVPLVTEQPLTSRSLDSSSGRRR
jgi:hypothetical protein